MVTVVSEDNSLQQLVSSLAASKEVIVGLCVLALGELRTLWSTRRPQSPSHLSSVPSPVHGPHDDHPLYLGRPRLDPHLAGGPGIAG